MSVQESIELLRRAWAAYDQGDEEGFAACLTPDWLEYGGSGSGEGAGLEDERPTMRLHREAFPDRHTEIHRIVASDTVVACHCTVTATHTGPYLDLEPTDKRVVVHEMMFNEVRDGRLAVYVRDGVRSRVLRADRGTPKARGTRQPGIGRPSPALGGAGFSRQGGAS